MTREEAEAIAGIIESADGGCPSCVGSLADALSERFPEFAWALVTDDNGDEVYPLTVAVKDGDK